MSEATISLNHPDETLALLGTRDQFLRRIRDVVGARVSSRAGKLHLEGGSKQVSDMTEVFRQLRLVYKDRGQITSLDVDRALETIQRGAPAIDAGRTIISGRSRVRARSSGQAELIDALENNDVVFAIGPAGTGKTYLAVAWAVSEMLRGNTHKIVLVRPAVEAGEKLGFLPGDLVAKINPYLRPLFDSLNDLLEYEQVKRYMETDLIEIVPLAFMRGRTLNNATIILDEGQNATVGQMKMFLTRMGEGSHIVVTGDITQVDLPDNVRSGLSDAVERLGDVDGIAAIRLTKKDIVRHPLVQKIVQSYEEGEASDEA